MMSADNIEDAESSEQMEESYEVGADDLIDTVPPDWSSLTVAALRAELVERGLTTTGRKAELVARLEASFSGPIESLEDEASADGTKETDEVAETEPDQEVVVADEPAEGDDENVDEFVEWNQELEHDVSVGEEVKTGVEDESFKVKVVDEVKEDEAKPETETVETKPSDDDHLAEGDTKTEGGEMSVDVDKDKDLFYLMWNSKKIVVPFKSEITKDLSSFHKLQTIVVYPMTTSDVFSDALKNYIDTATGILLQLEDTLPGKEPKGYLKLKFSTVGAAREALEALQTFKEGITVKHFSKEESESHIMNRMRKDDCDRKGPTIFRLIFVGNLPADATEAALRECFPEALQVIIPYNEETSEQLGYAYLECADEKVAYEVTEKYKDVELNGEKLYVIQAISEKKEKYGLLRDSLRLYWSEQIHKLRKIIDKPYSRPQWEVSDAEQKMLVLKRRLEKDKRRREVLHIPCPEYVPTEEDANADKAESEKPAKKEDRSSKERRSSHRDHHSSSSRSPRRRTPPPRRDFHRPGRGGRGMQNFQPRRDDVADKLVNQLQGLVSALTHKLPAVEPPRPLLQNLQFGALQGYLDSRRQMGDSGFSGGYRGASNYGDSSSRYSSGKRYHDDDSYGPDRKRRAGDYGQQSSSSRYGGGQTRGGHSYDSRYSGGRRDNSDGRQFNRSKGRGGGGGNFGY